MKAIEDVPGPETSGRLVGADDGLQLLTQRAQPIVGGDDAAQPSGGKRPGLTVNACGV